MPPGKPGTTPTPAAMPAKAGTPSASGPSGTQSSATAAASAPVGVDYEAKFKAEEKARKEREKELQQAREAIEQHTRAQNTEVENMKADFEQLEGKAEAFEEFKYTTFLELAILKDNSYQWYDVEDVRAAIEALGEDVVTIDDKGKIDGLDDALKQIAERKPHLMKPAGTPQGPTSAPLITPEHAGPSGAQPSGTPGGNADFDVAAIKKKYKIA